MNASTWPPLSLLALSIPVVLGLAAVWTSPVEPFRRAVMAAYVSLAGALALLVLVPMGPAIGNGSAGAALAHLVQMDVVTRVMLVLVTFLGLVVLRYSRTYLARAPGQQRYVRAFLAALSAITMLVSSASLLVMAFAWIGTSLALHQLLTFYRQRPQALVVAHKKFILSRLADGCVLGALALVHANVGSLELGAVNQWASAHAALPYSMQLAALLLVFAVLLKSAQLPFHGWLIQVMEAPTPVSALLHAGIVNIGGFLMIRLAPFMAAAPLAQTVLVLVGTVTAVVAALVMSTRVTVKVALAWSTCAQMGFMLVECGLGLWHVALLHLLAHSLYKAHAFLASGSTVDAWRVEAIVGKRSLSGVLGGGVRAVVGVTVRCVLGAALYAGGHALSRRLVPVPMTSAPLAAWPIAVAGLLTLVFAQLLFAFRPHGPLAGALARRLFAGLYLDEIFTRLTFELWPPQRPRREETPAPAAVRRVVSP